ncbi:unnamed protein product [Lactuca virosa]|uniref:Reverse transcriptase zinc-binding domain-containing protein n=1 Tax=Lactuca virosa TaxID=75947 RepID=A0AAU9MA63_9ASTR|nr:unnamed protein product [Lactuca virosa]
MFPVRLGASGVWKNIVGTISDFSSQNIALQDMFKRVIGIGNSFSFCFDNWAENFDLRSKYPSIFALESFKICSIADRCQKVHGSLVVSWNWRSPPSSSTELLELDSCLNDLSLVSLGTSDDKWSWLGCSSGVFSVSSLRGAWESKVYPLLEYKHFWNNLVPIKINFFSWRAVLNRLPVKTELIKRGVVLNSGTCDLCGAGDESVIHLL